MIKKFSIILPCYNEVLSLPELVNQLRFLNKSGLYEFILVNNGSQDETLEFLNSIAHEDLIIVNLTKNIGYGGAIKVAIDKATCEYIGWIHADLQYSIVDALNPLSTLNSNVKFIKGRRSGRSIFESVISGIMSIFESILFNQLILDINAQPTIVHRDLLEHLVDMPDDFSIDLYTYVTTIRQGIKPFRYKIKFDKRKFGKSSWNSGLTSVISSSIRTINYSVRLRIKHVNYSTPNKYNT